MDASNDYIQIIEYAKTQLRYWHVWLSLTAAGVTGFFLAKRALSALARGDRAEAMAWAALEQMQKHSDYKDKMLDELRAALEESEASNNALREKLIKYQKTKK